ncbi:hypothetical protein Avbf_14218 [Armadillidium vulgare]|nr:hypothetical protein Avbf_14218 [Armadillidium vulgare]
MSRIPMEYEIRLRGTKNRRFRNLSESSISRLFKRGGRMEKRLERSFARGLRKPIITDLSEKNELKKKKKDNKEKKDRLPRRKA